MQTALSLQPMLRFQWIVSMAKKVIQRQASDGINKADDLVELAMSGNVPVYHSGSASASSQSQNKTGGSVGTQDLHPVDEWCFPYASVCSWRWYSDRHCLFDRWSYGRYECPGCSRAL